MDGIGLTAEHLVLMAGVLLTIGYLVINQVILRLLVLGGTILYIVYYWVVADTPLWEAIYVSVVMGAANLIGLASLFLRNSRLNVPARFRELYDKRFSHMPPADFRQMMRAARHEVLETDRIITHENGEVTELVFMLEGRVKIEKLGNHFEMPAGQFIGEIAYLTGHPSSATTIATEGSEILVWSFKSLRSRAAHKPRFKLAFEAMISRDLARKVAVAVAPAANEENRGEIEKRLAQG